MTQSSCIVFLSASRHMTQTSLGHRGDTECKVLQVSECLLGAPVWYNSHQCQNGRESDSHLAGYSILNLLSFESRMVSIQKEMLKLCLYCHRLKYNRMLRKAEKISKKCWIKNILKLNHSSLFICF